MMGVGSIIAVVAAGALALAGCAASAPATGPMAGSTAGSASPQTPVASEPAPSVPLRWESALTTDEGYVTSVAATSVGTFVVAQGIRPGPCDPTPMWSDAAGVRLTSMDVDALLGEKASVTQVVAGGPGAVAVGCLPDPDRLMVWTTSDGTTWTASETGYLLPAGRTRFAMGSVAAGPERAILAGQEYSDLMTYAGTIEQAATEAMPASLRPYQATNILVEPQRASMVIGPFTVWSATLADLGVDPKVGEGYERAISGTATTPITVTTVDYRNWTVSREPPVPDLPNPSIVATSDGFLATSWNFMGDQPVVLSSVDGQTWQPVAFPVAAGTPGPLTAYGQWALSASWSTDGVAGLWQTGDLGASWTEITAAPAGYWGTPTVGALGYLVTTTAGDPPGGPIEFSFQRDGLLLTISLGMDGGSLRLADGDRTIVDEELSGQWRTVTAPASVAFDNEAGEMTVVDPTSGKTLMRLPYADVDAAFAKAVTASGVGISSAAFSTDGFAWSTGPLPGPPDRFSGAGPVAVGDDAAWVAVNHGFGGSDILRGTLPSATNP